EMTVCSALSDVLDGRGVPPIGRPIANARVFVLDERLGLVPPGVAGELYVAGGGVARGDLGRPGLPAGRVGACPVGVPGGGGCRGGGGVVVGGGAGGGGGELGRAGRPAGGWGGGGLGVRGVGWARPGVVAGGDGGGGLELLGRVDDQVKVRGFRVELGEVEA